MIHPSACMARAKRQGMPSNDFRGGGCGGVDAAGKNSRGVATPAVGDPAVVGVSGISVGKIDPQHPISTQGALYCAEGPNQLGHLLIGIGFIADVVGVAVVAQVEVWRGGDHGLGGVGGNLAQYRAGRSGVQVPPLPLAYYGVAFPGPVRLVPAGRGAECCRPADVAVGK